VVSSLSGFRKLGWDGERIISIAAMGRKIFANFDQERKISSRVKRRIMAIRRRAGEKRSKGTPSVSPIFVSQL